MGRPGLEPGTYGLKVRSSAIELATPRERENAEPILSTQAYPVRVGGFGTHAVHVAWVLPVENIDPFSPLGNSRETRMRSPVTGLRSEIP